jgi:uncharacterized protein involved in exopolysaccharide biosynthesis
MREEEYDSYEDWYDHGEGSEEYNNRAKKSMNDVATKAWNRNAAIVNENRELKEKNTALKEEVTRLQGLLDAAYERLKNEVQKLG